MLKTQLFYDIVLPLPCVAKRRPMREIRKLLKWKKRFGNSLPPSLALRFPKLRYVLWVWTVVDEEQLSIYVPPPSATIANISYAFDPSRPLFFAKVLEFAQVLHRNP